MADFFGGWMRRGFLAGIGLMFSVAVWGHGPGESGDEELHAILESGAREDLVRFLETRAESFVAESEIWRGRLPEFKRHGMLEVAAERLDESWKKAADRPEILFALAELRLFEGKLEEAKEQFWRVLAMEEEAEPRGGRGFFQRLNYAFHDRFGAKYRIAEATGRYGTRMCLEFTFLGLRENVRVPDSRQARTAALLYLKELEMPRMSSADFLKRVGVALDAVDDRPVAERMFAYAVVGGPRALVAEVERFLAAPGKDDAGVEFGLLAMNRFVLSNEKFPDLRERMLAATRLAAEKLSENAPEATRAAVEEIRGRILRRLGEAEPAPVPEAGSREEHFQRISAAVDAGNPEEAERIFREIEAKGNGGAGFERALLFLGRAWEEAGNPERAARVILEYLERTYPAARGAASVSAPVEWHSQTPFPPANRIFGMEAMELLDEVFQLVHRDGIWPVFREAIASRRMELAEEKRLEGCVAELSFLWWANEREKAVRAAEDWAELAKEPETVLLWAHLLGRMEDFEAARSALENMAGERAERMRFAFAVAAKEAERAEVSAGKLENAELSAEERLQVGFGLMSLGMPEAGGKWVEGLGNELGNPGQMDRLHQVELRAVQAKGEPEEATIAATRILLSEVPFSFRELLSPARAAALAVLEENGELERYERGFRESYGLSPDKLAFNLLLGEAAEFRWIYLKEPEAESETIGWYKKALEENPDPVDLPLFFAEWAAGRGLDDLAVETYQSVLPIDAQSVLLDSASVFEAYRRAGRLSDLVIFLEEWRSPDAISIDDFYGLQPTEHLFRPLGEMLSEDGNEEFAERAWRKGLEMNPLAFTEEIRMRLVEFYLRESRISEAVGAMKSYFAARDPDPELYAMHPFVEMLPRWMSGLRAASDPERPPAERLLKMVREAGAEEAVLAAAEKWEEEFPERFSAAAFRVYWLARLGREEWLNAAEAVRARFPEEGVTIPMRAAAEEIWESAAARER